ncbi:hypothetical protein LI328DRAFT_69086 [Trichoderma asperelloides]|nr:hypothetical protein LI328DRAFT_69086 [Trichoderma asperelloides]
MLNPKLSGGAVLLLPPWQQQHQNAILRSMENLSSKRMVELYKDCILRVSPQRSRQHRFHGTESVDMRASTFNFRSAQPGIIAYCS